MCGCSKTVGEFVDSVRVSNSLLDGTKECTYIHTYLWYHYISIYIFINTVYEIPSSRTDGDVLVFATSVNTFVCLLTDDRRSIPLMLEK